MKLRSLYTLGLFAAALGALGAAGRSASRLWTGARRATRLPPMAARLGPRPVRQTARDLGHRRRIPALPPPGRTARRQRPNDRSQARHADFPARRNALDEPARGHHRLLQQRHLHRQPRDPPRLSLPTCAGVKVRTHRMATARPKSPRSDDPYREWCPRFARAPFWFGTTSLPGYVIELNPGERVMHIGNTSHTRSERHRQ